MNQENTKQAAEFERMTKTPIPRLITSLAVPTIVSMMITAVYNLADAFFVAKLGTSASGATGVVFALMAIIQAVGFTVGMGSGSTISRLLGDKNNKLADEMGSSALVTALLFGAIITAAGLIFLTPLMRLLGSTETILPYAKDYALYILIAAPIMSASFVLGSLLRAEGKAKLSMIGIGIGGLLNVGLDPLFIFTFNMGVSGAAIATALSQLVGFSILASNFVCKRTIINLSFRNISKKLSVYKTFLWNGMPSFFRQGLASIATVALNNAAAVYGDAAMAAMSIVTKVLMVVFSALVGFAQGYQPVAGYNYGARLYPRVKKAYFFVLGVGIASMAVLSAAVFVLAPNIMTWFIPSDPKVIEIGITALRAQCIAMPFIAFGVTCNMTFQSVGRSGIATFLSSCRQGIFFFPLIILLPNAYGLLGVQITQAAADILTFLMGLPFIIVFLKNLVPKTGQELEEH